MVHFGTCFQLNGKLSASLRTNLANDFARTLRQKGIPSGVISEKQSNGTLVITDTQPTQHLTRYQEWTTLQFVLGNHLAHYQEPHWQDKKVIGAFKSALAQVTEKLNQFPQSNLIGVESIDLSA
jgi:hypothetical protein